MAQLDGCTAPGRARRAARSGRALVGAALLALSCVGAPVGEPSDARLVAARRTVPVGARLFNLHCASCHGEHGRAPGVPPVMGSGALRARPGLESALELYRLVESSMPPGGRRASGLSEADYWAVTEYLVRVAGIELSRPLDAPSASGVGLEKRH